MGAAGDMLSAALLELLPEPGKFIKRLNNIFAPEIVFEVENCESNGITGRRMHVIIKGEEEGEKAHHSHNHSHHHSHTSYKEIKKLVSDLDVPKKVKTDILRVYDIIAQAESKVHGTEVEEVHFHEVGALDAVGDITAVCLLLDEINPGEIIVSPINTGFGTVNCAHGILPVPAPATAEILKGIPTFTNEISGELCTPTGAALLSYFADEFSEIPQSKTIKIGYGLGKKEFSAPNCIRAFACERTCEAELVCELSCDVDDMTPEEIAFSCEQLLCEGARDVSSCPVIMKKGRIGTRINVLCYKADREKILSLIFKHTTTIGVRETRFRRYSMIRSFEDVSTPCGKASIKHSEGFGTQKSKAEYEDVARIARENNISFREAKKLVESNE